MHSYDLTNVRRFFFHNTLFVVLVNNKVETSSSVTCYSIPHESNKSSQIQIIQCESKSTNAHRLHIDLAPAHQNTTTNTPHYPIYTKLFRDLLSNPVHLKYVLVGRMVILGRDKLRE
jgi:hypothetical protein